MRPELFEESSVCTRCVVCVCASGETVREFQGRVSVWEGVCVAHGIDEGRGYVWDCSGVGECARECVAWRE